MYDAQVHSDQMTLVTTITVPCIGQRVEHAKYVIAGTSRRIVE